MNNTITIYSTPTCGFCHMLKSYLKDKSIAFSEKDITTDQEAYKTVINKTGMAAVPVMEVGNKFVIGFDRPRIDALLTENNLLK